MSDVGTALVIGILLIGLFVFDLSFKLCSARSGASADERAEKAMRGGKLCR
jgi:hypothetical protein